MNKTQNLLDKFYAGDKKSLARCITIVENESAGYEKILSSLIFEKTIPVIGFTGPPGAGKSTLINAILKNFTASKKRIGIIAIDPTSPFNYGSLLGDRLRMSEHFNNENIFIRSLATRGSLGGLSAKTIEITDVMRAFSIHNGDGNGGAFDYIFIETVGVGQSEIEIAGLADITVLVLSPQSGDEIQTMKSGIMEIAGILVVNKADHPDANVFSANLKNIVRSKKNSLQIPIIETIATEGKGTEELIDACIAQIKTGILENNKKSFLLTEKAYRLIQNNRMKDVDREKLRQKIENEMKKKDFNLYEFVKKFLLFP